MEELQEKELRLLENATGVFMRFGIKSVNMDDMARHLSMSKKTLYQYVKDKEDLVNKVISLFIHNENSSVNAIHEKQYDAIEESLEIMRWVTGVLQNIHPSVMYDLHKYHPEASKRMQEAQEKTISESILKNLKKGQREGLYRKDFNPEVITRLYATRVDHVFYQTFSPSENIKLSDLYKEAFKYHIHGIASALGLERLKEKMKNIKI